jgi:CBS domain-containing membrane protein
MAEKCSQPFDPAKISDEDIHEAMRSIEGYLDITAADLREIYMVAYRHALRRLQYRITATETMSTPVHSVQLHTSMAGIAALMAERRLTGLPVLAEDGQVAGMITEKDILSRLTSRSGGSFMAVIAEFLASGNCAFPDISGLQAADIMSAPAVTVAPTTTVAEIAGLFRTRKINRVPVVDAGNRLLGIITRDDLIGIIP